MRILVDATAVNEGGGGICTFLLGLLSGWNAAGFNDDWSIFGMRDLPKEVDHLLGGRGTVYRKNAPHAARRVITQQLRIPAAARGRSWPADVVLAMTPVIPAIPTGTPIVAVVYDLRSLRFPEEFGAIARSYRRVVYKHGLRRADGLLAISEFTRREIQLVVPRRRSDPTVIHLGADHVDDWDGSPTPARHGITFAHWSNKRPDVAIRAWAILHLKEPSCDVLLHVVGTRDGDSEYLRTLSKDLRIDHLVRIHPFLDGPSYQRLFASSSIVLFPSTMEGFGLPITEAQRLGIPVVASAVGAVMEVGGDAALYSTSGSPDSFAELCAEALYDSHRREELISRGHTNVRNFTWRRTAEQVRDELARTIVRSGCRKRVAK